MTEECVSRRESSLGRAERRERDEGELRARRLVSENNWPVENKINRKSNQKAEEAG